MQDLNRLYQREPSLHEVDFDDAGFSWIDCSDHENSVISMVRRAKNPLDFTVIAVNFTPVPRPAYRIGVPEGGWYRELLNSDAAAYGGGNLGNGGGVRTETIAAHGHRQSLSLMIPPLACVVMKRA